MTRTVMTHRNSRYEVRYNGTEFEVRPWNGGDWRDNWPSLIPTENKSFAEKVREEWRRASFEALGWMVLKRTNDKCPKWEQQMQLPFYSKFTHTVCGEEIEYTTRYDGTSFEFLSLTGEWKSGWLRLAGFDPEGNADDFSRKLATALGASVYAAKRNVSTLFGVYTDPDKVSVHQCEYTPVDKYHGIIAKSNALFGEEEYLDGYEVNIGVSNALNWGDLALFDTKEEAITHARDVIAMRVSTMICRLNEMQDLVLEMI